MPARRIMSPSATAKPQIDPSRDVFPPPPRWPRTEADLFLEADGDLAHILWQRLRDVRLWALTPPQNRAALFQPPGTEFRAREESAVAVAPDVADEIHQLGILVRYPTLPAHRSVSDLCLAVSDWAVKQHMTEVALHFAEAAAVADSTYPKAAAIAGSYCTQTVATERASTWFHRAIRLSRRQRDWEWYARAHIRLGILFTQTGQHISARAMYLKAARNATWAGYREYAGQGWHGMLTVEGEVGTFRNGQAYALKALERYPVNYYGVPNLAADYAYLLLRQGWYSAAQPLLSAVLETLGSENRARIIILGSVARVAAGLRDWRTFDSVASEILLRAEISEEGAATALIHLSEGTRVLSEWDEAERLAARGLSIAIRRKEADTIRMAYAKLDQIMLRTAPERNQEPPATAKVAGTVKQFLRRMAAARAPAVEAEAPAPVPANVTALTALAK
jgi:tetratricopeptide (TPR) repeat protein